MNYFIFNFNRDYHLIPSFLNSSSVSHNEKIKTKDWFYWKFKDNPFGESILACAIEGGEIVGCVAFGIQDFIYNNVKVKAAVSFETFVHPNFQGKGIFKKLISIAEEEAFNRNVDFLLNFPNSNSLPGFNKSGWNNIQLPEYWIKGNNYFKLFFKIYDIKKTFLPNPSNIDNLVKVKEFETFFHKENNSFKSIVDNNYLDWRFFKYPNAEYIIIDNENFFSIARVGFRGKLKEVQVLFVEFKSDSSLNFSILIKEYKKQCKYDIISFPISKTNKIKKNLKKMFFFRVPNSTNVTYKKISKKKQFDFSKLELSAINYHTY